MEKWEKVRQRAKLAHEATSVDCNGGSGDRRGVKMSAVPVWSPDL